MFNCTTGIECYHEGHMGISFGIFSICHRELDNFRGSTDFGISMVVFTIIRMIWYILAKVYHSFRKHGCSAKILVVSCCENQGSKAAAF